MANQTTYSGNKTGSAYNVTVAKPIDVRTVVNIVEDLTNGTIPYLYQGLVVNVKGTGDLYVLASPVRLASQMSSWVKVGDTTGYVKEEDIADFITSSELDGYVKTEVLEDYIPKTELDNLVSKSDLDGYVKAEDAVDFLTSSELEGYLDGYMKVSELPTNVSAFVNDAGYLTRHQSLDGYAKKADLPDFGKFVEVDDIDTLLPDFLTGSDLDGYVKTEDLEGYIPKTELENLASKSDLDGYVRTEDAIEYLTSSDLDEYAKVSEIPTNVSAFINDAGYITSHDLPDFLMESDLDGYVKTEDLEGYIPASKLDELASKSDLEGYVRMEDTLEYLTEEDLDGYIKNTDLPDFLMESDLDGYVKTEDLEGYIPKAELDNLASKSDLDGYVKTEDAVDFLTGSDLDGYARIDDIPVEGMFPADSDIEDETAAADGYAKVQDVIDYVNALIEKKKEEEDSIRYAYINGYALDGTPTDITIFNKFLLNKEGDTVIEIKAPVEITAYDPVTYEDLPSVKLVVDIPEGYSLKSAYIWNEELGTDGDYEILDNDYRAFGVNPRYSTRVIDGIIYNSYARGPVDETVAYSGERYKIIITKQ